MRVWSHYQKAIFSELSLSDQNLAVLALAGSGKTSVITESNHLLPDSMKVLSVCFNKNIAEELRKRLPRSRETGTLNSIGNGIVKRVFPNAIFDENKNFAYLSSHFKNYGEDKKRLTKISGAVKRTVSLLKALNCTEWPQNWVDLLDSYGVETGDFNPEDQFDYWAEKVFTYSIKETKIYDYDDQIYFPIAHSLPIQRRNMVFVDEMQDLSPVQIQFVIRLGERIMSVGDRHQAIYVFRGADLNAVDRLIQETDAKEMPLSISYRCPIAIIEEAKRYVPEIEASPEANQGLVESIKKEQMYKRLNGEEMVLCRNTAPLIRECLRQIRRKQKAFVRGRDIGDKIFDLIDKVGRICHSDNVFTFLPALQEYKIAQLDKLSSSGREAEAEQLQDRVDSIIAFAEDASTIQDIFNVMNEVFSDGAKSGTEYSTIHKSKGKEKGTVYRLDSWLCPSPKVKPALLRIEYNLKYVEITRSQNELFTVIKED